MSRQPQLPVAEQGGDAEVLRVERVSASPAGLRASRSARRKDTAPAPAAWSLEEQQRWFLAVMVDPQPIERALTAALARSGQPDARALLTEGPRSGVADRMGVYHYAYRARLREVLADDFPAVQYTLGPERFEALCNAVITAHPSVGPNLNHYGRVLVEHLESGAGRVRNRAFCTELARLEWALVEAVHAPPPTPLDLTTLQALSPEEWALARFRPSPTLLVLSASFPVNPYFQAWRTGQTPSVPRRRPSAVAVYRQGYTLWRMPLSPIAHRLLEGLIADKPLGEALGEVEDQAGADQVMRWFAAWVAGGFFESVA